MDNSTDSDLALALALADNSNGSSQDEDFQRPSHNDQLIILKSCGSFSGKRPHRKSKRQKTDNRSNEVLQTLHINAERDSKARRVQKRGKENRNHSREECKNAELCNAAQDSKSSGNAGKSRRSLDDSCQKEGLQGTVDDIQNCSTLAVAYVSHYVASPAEGNCRIGASFPEDESSHPSDGGLCEIEGLPSHQTAEQQMEEVASLARDEESLEDVVRLDEEDPNIIFSVTERKMDELKSTWSSSRSVDFVNSGSRDKETDFRRQISQSQGLSIPSTDSNSERRFSALLRLCVDATREDSQAEGGLVGQPNHAVSEFTSTKASDRAEAQELFEEQEDIMSMMTQSRNLAENSVDKFLFDQEAEQKTHRSPLRHENDSLTNQCTPQKACINLKQQSSDPSLEVITSEDGMVFCSNSEKERFDLSFQCPICGKCISGMSHEQREVHTNLCLDSIDEDPVKAEGNSLTGEQEGVSSFDVAPVLRWLESLDLSRYANVFIREEIDWDTLKWLTDEDLCLLGITALGPRRKIVCSLQQLQQKTHEVVTEDLSEKQQDGGATNPVESDASGKTLISDFFALPPNLSRTFLADPQVPPSDKDRARVSSRAAVQKRISAKIGGIPKWMSIPGTKFRVDAFQHLRGDCSHWFLTHFHTDHYQGLTRGFRYGHVYCSSITAQLVNTRIGVPWECLKPLPLNKKIEIEGVNVTFIDANHCPGSVMILFEPQFGKAVLHTGDFRFCEDMANDNVLRMCKVHTLILDTTYCKLQYDFPKQEVVIQFVIDAIQAEAFNPNTLFLIGTYTVGKERIFLEVAKALQKKIYVGAAKLRLLQCMRFSQEEMQWMTTNDQESCIHVVPLWTISSFKRMKYVSHHYHGRYNSIVSFSPTGWSFGRGKKRTPGRRWQQGTIVRYEVPYSEHSSFKELRDFVEFVAPVDIVPSVHNTSAEAADAMVALLLNEEESV